MNFCRHGGSRWARRSVASRAGRPPKVRPKVCESSGWQMVLCLGLYLPICLDISVDSRIFGWLCPSNLKKRWRQRFASCTCMIYGRNESQEVKSARYFDIVSPLFPLYYDHQHPAPFGRWLQCSRHPRGFGDRQRKWRLLRPSFSSSSANSNNYGSCGSFFGIVGVDAFTLPTSRTTATPLYSSYLDSITASVVPSKKKSYSPSSSSGGKSNAAAVAGDTPPPNFRSFSSSERNERKLRGTLGSLPIREDHLQSLISDE